MNINFWKDKRVLITGHTGFKGSWLSLILCGLGAKVTGYALNPPTEPSLYDLCNIGQLVDSNIADIRDLKKLTEVAVKAKPDIVIHMAAQPLVRESYNNPVETYETNVMGTVNILEAIRQCESVKAAVIITTDKCYQNNEWLWGYREEDRLGGFDPYSNSKACAELVISSYRSSFFGDAGSAAIASTRAGNVIGGGDWAQDRLIPDCIRALIKNEAIKVRNPNSIRPWQHVLEPLSGYLILAEKLYTEGKSFAQSFNFGPDDSDAKPVLWIVKKMCEKWGGDAKYDLLPQNGKEVHEAGYLKLDCSKAKTLLNWTPRWNLDKALDKIVEWSLVYKNGGDIRKITTAQIEEFLNEG